MEIKATVWSNGGRSEWIIYRGEEIVARSGMIYRSNSVARRAMIRHASTIA